MAKADYQWQKETQEERGSTLGTISPPIRGSYLPNQPYNPKKTPTIGVFGLEGKHPLALPGFGP